MKFEDPDAHFSLGVIYQEADYLPQAKAEYERVLELRPDYWAAWRNLGETLYEMGNRGKTAERREYYEKAAEAYQKALQINRIDARTHYDLGLLYYRQANIEESYLKRGKYRLAALEFQKATPEMDLNPELHLNLGVIFDQLEQYAEAASSYARAATLAPESPVPYYLGGVAERNAKRYDMAEPLLKKAVELDPDNQDALYALAIVYQEMDKEPLAQSYFTRAATASQKGFTQGVTIATLRRVLPPAPSSRKPEVSSEPFESVVEQSSDEAMIELDEPPVTEADGVNLGGGGTGQPTPPEDEGAQNAAPQSPETSDAEPTEVMGDPVAPTPEEPAVSIEEFEDVRFDVEPMAPVEIEDAMTPVEVE